VYRLSAVLPVLARFKQEKRGAKIRVILKVEFEGTSQSYGKDDRLSAYFRKKKFDKSFEL
jgi:hypothetical protein